MTFPSASPLQELPRDECLVNYKDEGNRRQVLKDYGGESNLGRNRLSLTGTSIRFYVMVTEAAYPGFNKLTLTPEARKTRPAKGSPPYTQRPAFKRDCRCKRKSINA
jgi:hypothetical protein